MNGGGTSTCYVTVFVTTLLLPFVSPLPVLGSLRRQPPTTHLSFTSNDHKQTNISITKAPTIPTDVGVHAFQMIRSFKFINPRYVSSIKVVDTGKNFVRRRPVLGDFRSLLVVQSSKQTRCFSAQVESRIQNDLTFDSQKNKQKRLARLRQRRKQQQQKNKVKVAKLLEEKKGSWMIEKKNRRAFETLFEKLAARFPLTKIEGEIERLRTIKGEGEPLVLEFQRILNDDSSRLAHLKRSIVQFMLMGDISVDRSTPQTTVNSNDVEVFMKARERALTNDLSWNLLDAKELSGMSRVDHQIVIRARRERHDPKTESQKKREAQRLVKYLGEQLPPRLYKSVVSLFEDYIGGLDNNNIETLPSALKTVGRSIERRAPTHYHIIASEVADFFYLNDGLSHNVIDQDEVAKKSQATWDTLKLDVVDSLLSLQDVLLDSAKQHPEALLNEHASSDTDDEDALVMEKDIEIQAAPDLSQKIDRRFRKPRHATFEAVVLEEDFTLCLDDLSELSRRTVFLDNLPIDITLDELRDLYSRCGAVEDIHIYNQRPELDPGPLSAAKSQELRKKQLDNSKGSFRNWRRPRSPVYGQIIFRDEMGSQKALVDSLRIFGMVVRRHPIRSIRANDMKHLYLENMPEGFTTMDAEYMLNNELYPNLLLCLDSGQNNRAVLGSCEIRFPSFEIAYNSFKKLQSMEAVSHESEISIQWLRTPKDANMWWTRQSGIF